MSGESNSLTVIAVDVTVDTVRGKARENEARSMEVLPCSEPRVVRTGGNGDAGRPPRSAMRCAEG